ncbi:MAG: type II secretion system protein [Minisyncoccia bacterium]
MDCHVGRPPRNDGKRGFTLIELLVTLSIFVIVGSVILFSQSQFNGSILLSNLSYDLALTIRQAQTFGVGGKSFGFDDTQKPRYGVHLDTTNSKSIVFFADLDGGGTYDVGICPKSTIDDNLECLETYNIKKGNSIKKICEYQGENTSCTDSYSSVDITFERPDPDAVIYVEKTKADFSAVEIVIGDDSDSQTRSVVVTSVGQIFIKK